ncbi:MAG: CBS domain-containing protein [Acidobacteriota bacterium]
MREHEIQTSPIRHLPLDPAICVESGTSLHDVIARMREGHASCVLICKENRCLGIFTERDYLNKVLSTPGTDRLKPIDDFMTSEPKTLGPENTVGTAVRMMSEFGFRNIPLVDSAGNCTRLLQIRNIIQFLAELYPEEVLNVQPRREAFQQPDGA